MTDHPEASPPGAPNTRGAVGNTLLQLAAQLTGAVFTAALTLYLVRALGPAGYGVFAIAVSISLLVLLPSDIGLSAATARFLAERRDDPEAASGVLARGLQLKLIAGTLTTIALFALAPLIAHAYGDSGLTWPIRWVAIALFGQGLVYFLNACFAAVRMVSSSLKTYAVESAAETAASIVLVGVGLGVAGAALGRAVGYAVGAAAGLILVRPVSGPFRRAWGSRRALAVRTIGRYAGSMMIVDAAHTAIAQLDVLFIAGIVSVQTAGPFAAVTRLFTLVNYLGTAVASGVAPRLARTATTEPDARVFELGLKYVVICEGVFLAPLVVWAKPIVALALGSGYGDAVGIMRALAPTAILGGLATVLALGVNYLGEARRRVPVMLGVLLLGVALTYLLVETVGVIGAAIADDVVLLAHVIAHLWICRRMIEINVRRFALTNVRTLAAAAAMALTLAAVGTARLSPSEWILGSACGVLVFLLALLLSGEVTRRELASAWQTTLTALRRVKPTRVGI